MTAAAREVPPALIHQLAPMGKMVIPIGDSSNQELRLIEKDEAGVIHTSFIEHVRFVRLKKEKE